MATSATEGTEEMILFDAAEGRILAYNPVTPDEMSRKDYDKVSDKPADAPKPEEKEIDWIEINRMFG